MTVHKRSSTPERLIGRLRRPTKLDMLRLLVLLPAAMSTLLLLPSAAAQTLPVAHSHTGVSGLIDGAQHPELIPDQVAYRLYFVVVSEMPNATQQERLRQAAHLKSIGVTKDEDLQSLIQVLTDFKVRYTQLVTAYNQVAEAADRAGSSPDFGTFLRNRDDLVQSTRDRLTSTLSAEALALLDARVQSEKTHMKVSVGEAQ